MKFFDALAGCGSSRLGFEKAGHECVDACEIGIWQRRVYAKHFGEEPKWKDIKKIEYEKVPDFELLIAGLPCQPFSVANTTGIRGFSREDAQLFFSVLQLISHKRPTFILFENVQGLLSDSKGKSFATWLLHLEKMGYDAEWAYFNGASFGLQCGHEHIFLIGWDNKKICPEETLLQRKDVDIISFKVQKKKRQIIQRITTRVRNGFDNTTLILDEYGFRSLIPEEIEQIIGLPKGWTRIAPQTERHKMLGNAWPPAMAEFLGKHVLPNTAKWRKKKTGDPHAW